VRVEARYRQYLIISAITVEWIIVNVYMQLMSALAGIHGMQQTDKTSIFYNTQTVSIDILYMPTE